MAKNDTIFQTMDFIFFIGFFILSLLVGLIFAYRDRKNKSTANYYYGGKDVSPIPVALSIAVSFVSAITVIGFPAEVYFYGIAMLFQSLGVAAVTIVVCKYFIPLYHKLQVTSVCQYLELRFNRTVRLAVSVFSVLWMLTYMAIATFVPSLALSTVTPLDLKWTIAITTITCTVYTTLGGFVAVIWTDVLQSAIMVIGMLAIFISSICKLGGFDSVLDAAYRGGRLSLSVGMDPRERSSVSAIFLGMGLSSCYVLGCSQPYVQRWLSCRTITKARIATTLALVPLLLLSVTSCLTGLAAYAYYEGCDPLTSSQIEKPDQLIPHMSVQVLRDIPGMAGMFVSAGFCGTLSSVSSGINALSVQILEDFVLIKYPGLPQKRRILIGKIIATLCGMMTLLNASLVTLSPDNVTQLLNVYSVFGGPLVAVYSMGIFMPWIGSKGVLIGSSIGTITAAVITFAAMILPVDKSQWQRLPLLTDECSTTWWEFNSSTATPETLTVAETTNITIEDSNIGALGSSVFAISPFYYGVTGLLMAIISGHIASIFTGFREPSEETRELSISFINERLLPRKLQRYFIEEDRKYTKGEEMIFGKDSGQSKSIAN